MFKYNQPDGILELCLQDTPSLESGWTVHPDQSPMQVCVLYMCIMHSMTVTYICIIIDTSICSGQVYRQSYVFQYPYISVC